MLTIHLSKRTQICLINLPLTLSTAHTHTQESTLDPANTHRYTQESTPDTVNSTKIHTGIYHWSCHHTHIHRNVPLILPTAYIYTQESTIHLPTTSKQASMHASTHARTHAHAHTHTHTHPGIYHDPANSKNVYTLIYCWFCQQNAHIWQHTYTHKQIPKTAGHWSCEEHTHMHKNAGQWTYK